MESQNGEYTSRLQARDVTIHYWLERSNRPFLAVDGVSLDVGSGEFLAIVGPSGCGKTTFLNAVDGLVPISGGTLTLDGIRYYPYVLRWRFSSPGYWSEF